MKKRTSILIILTIFLGLNVFAQKHEYLTDKTFKTKVFDYENTKAWKYEGNTPAIVDFYADWCRPCKQIAPILEELSKEYKGKIKIYKVNTDHNPQVSKAFGIKSIPSLLFIPKTGQPSMSTGGMSKASFEKAIKEVLKITK